MKHTYLLPKLNLDAFFSALQSLGTVYAPVKVSEQSFSFRAVKSPTEIAFEALRTILPPKKFFYPQSETLIEYDENGVREHEPQIEVKVLFGVHPCDLAGLGILDTIFSAAPTDSHYLKRRKASFVVGLSCMPDRFCFCQSMDTDCPEKGYDLFLTDLGDRFLIEAITQAGVKLAEKAQAVLQPAQDKDRDDYKDFWKVRSESFTNGFAPDNLRAVMNMESENVLWKELGEQCLSCGNCTPVCPTCYCFDVFDIASLHEDAGERRREWDSCQFSGFATVAGDFNFRPTPVDRLKYWYQHKLHGFDDPYGFKTCVGCGRCTVSCPAGIDDIVSVVKRLQATRETAGGKHDEV